MDNNRMNTTTISRHRHRYEQLPIFFMKLIRMFVYQNDWVSLPLSAVIAGMVSMVIKNGFGVNMDGTLKGAFALSCVAIWNGCFNSIQAVCRERNVVKREHRSGMHVTSYLFAHALYQFLVCLIQTALTVSILRFAGVHLDGPGIVTKWMILDIGISLFLITFAADLLSLMISCVVRNTTVAMTVMPFVLIFQLVFSGGIFNNLPEWAAPFSDLTLSKFGLNCIAAQVHYNDLPMEMGWQLVSKIKDETLPVPRTMGELLDISGHPEYKALFTEENLTKEIIEEITVDDLIQYIGEKEAKELVTERVAKASISAQFDSTVDNVIESWLVIMFWGEVYFILAIVALEFIDKDKR